MKYAIKLMMPTAADVAAAVWTVRLRSNTPSKATATLTL